LGRHAFLIITCSVYRRYIHGATASNGSAHRTAGFPA
jgi:hypothetical protein